MDTLLAIDHGIFFFINHLPHAMLSDAAALIMSGIGKSGIGWFVLAGILFYREEKKHPLFFAPVILAGSASYVIVELILKPWVARIRPMVDMGAVIVGEAKSDFSFPSGHATIAWTMAIVLSRFEPRWRWMFYTLALFISFSRIYLGVHYPLDVLGGAVLGIIIAWLSLTLGSYVRQRWTPTSPGLSKNIR